MDFFRPRAIPALIALAVTGAAHAACEGLDGTYRYEAASAGDGQTHSLGRFVMGREREKITRQERTAPQGLGSDQPRTRPKVTHLAATGTVAAVARGATIDYRDAQGKSLATIGIGEGWRCKGDALERDEEHTAGLGDNVRTERVQERLSKSGGFLVYSQTVTVIDPPGGKPESTEIRFSAVK